MADDNPQPDEDKAAKGPGIISWLAVLVIAGGAGFAVPFLLPASAPADESTEDSEVTSVEMLPAEESVVVEFGEITVNLDEGRMNRYLRMKISVLVAKKAELDVTAAIEAKGAVMKNWLLSHMSDKSLEEIRGKAGQNMLRRELRREFNEALFTDRKDRIYDVLFEEFNVQ